VGNHDGTSFAPPPSIPAIVMAGLVPAMTIGKRAGQCNDEREAMVEALAGIAICRDRRSRGRQALVRLRFRTGR
jgi:hypothetical protein